MRILLAGGALAVGLAVSAIAGTGEDQTKRAEFDSERMLSAAALRDAIRGQQFTFRAIRYEGDAAISFAQGYIAAVDGMATQDGAWCNTGIAPHEIVARVFDHIERLGDEATSTSADAAALVTLHELAPCKE